MKNQFITRSAIAAALFGLNAHISAALADGATDLIYEEIVSTARPEEIRSLPGSAAFLSGNAIAEFDTTDLNRLLARVPGVYIRAEDGYGLRPNIGIRGVTSDRSQKITLMEDGALITPAPYSAPAAYYIPNVSRMSAIEVYKGPAAIQHGPNTVGGAINLLTRPVPTVPVTRLGLTIGTDALYKAQLFHGDAGEGSRPAYWIDMLSYGSDGFKEIDGGGDSGFKRNDINAKLQWSYGELDGTYQELQVKLGYADEKSDETYLGLSDADFAANPDRRYAASQLDAFDSEHTQLHILHSAQFKSGLVFSTQAYINRFDRAWLKFADFADRSFNRFALTSAQRAVLSGAEDSDGSDAERIILTNNDREYGSQGIAFKLSKTVALDSWTHKLESGVRFHHDYIERDHQVFGFDMLGGQLVADSIDRPNSSLERAESDALAVYVRDEIEYRNWTFNAGLRYESIEGELDDTLNQNGASNKQSIVIPGVGVFYQWTDRIGLLAGVNKGFSPAGPKAADSVDPEESVNYEYGIRYTRDSLQADLIGFFSDYKNLLGRCRASDSGCEVGSEFNGGEAEIAGAELSLVDIVQLGGDIEMPVSLAYTYTETAFQTSFLTSFSQWVDSTAGAVTPYPTQGDALPYIPAHQARLQMGLHCDQLKFDAAVKYVDKMREVPGVGDEGVFTDELTTLDVRVGYKTRAGLELTLVGENITDERKIVSRRPLGARPSAPRTFKLGVEYSF